MFSGEGIPPLDLHMELLDLGVMDIMSIMRGPRDVMVDVLSRKNIHHFSKFTYVVRNILGRFWLLALSTIPGM